MEKVDNLLAKKKYTLDMLKPEHRDLYAALEAKISLYNEKFDLLETMQPEDDGYEALQAEVAALDAETTADENILHKKVNGFINGRANFKGKGTATANNKPAPAPAPVVPITTPAAAPVTPQTTAMPQGTIIDTPAQVVTDPQPQGTPSTPAVPISDDKKEKGNSMAVAIGVSILLGALTFGLYNAFQKR